MTHKKENQSILPCSPGRWVKPQRTQHALYHSSIPSAWNLCLKVDFPVTMLARGGQGTRSQVLFSSRAPYSSSIAVSQFGSARALRKVFRTGDMRAAVQSAGRRNPTLALVVMPCWFTTGGICTAPFGKGAGSAGGACVSPVFQITQYNSDTHNPRTLTPNTTGNLIFAECGIFAECIFSCTRQIRSLPSVIQKTLGKINTHGKQFFAECIIFWHSAKMRVCRVFFLHLANSSLPSVLFLALGKDHNLPSVFIYTWQRIKLFLTSNPKTFSTLHIQHVLLHVKISYIFVFVCYI